MNIKTFPLQFTKEELDRIGKVANKTGDSKKDFMYKAINDRCLRFENDIALERSK